MPSEARCEILNQSETEIVHCTLRAAWGLLAFWDGFSLEAAQQGAARKGKPHKGKPPQRSRTRKNRDRRQQRAEREEAERQERFERELRERRIGARMEWMMELVERLASLFAVEVVSFAILDNHVHLILRNRPDSLPWLSDKEVAERWLTITRLKRRGDFEGAAPEESRITALIADRDKLKQTRARIAHISWFMAAFAEHVSRRVSRETGKSGHCWEERYYSRVLTDDEAILACALYVDSNPVRANLAELPEEYPYSSIALRMQGMLNRPGPPRLETVHAMVFGGTVDGARAHWGDAFVTAFMLDQGRSVADRSNFRSASGARLSDKGVFGAPLTDYLALLDYVLRERRQGKSGSIPADALPVLARLDLDAERLVDTVVNFERLFRTRAACRDLVCN